MEHEDIKLVLTWKLYPYWLTFIVIEVLCSLLEEKSNHLCYSAVSPVSYNTDWPVKNAYLCNSGISIMGKTNHFLIRFMSCITR